KTFFNESINLTKGDTLYLFTDGYADQFGGKDDRKFLIKNFKQLLLSIQDLDLDAQKIVLEKEITDWIGYGDQVDDILVVGLRV
ncbi:MAG TPA: serine/threonine protein phosphatase, partial [Bacteroidales bacterium]|nr:serine/threonine protein phosphatase [Bacteroidales bacterium]